MNHYDTLQIAVKNPGLKHVANKEAGFTPGQPESVKIASTQPQHSSTPKKPKEDIQTGWCGLRQHLFSRLFASSGIDKRKCEIVIGSAHVVSFCIITSN